MDIKKLTQQIIFFAFSECCSFMICLTCFEDIGHEHETEKMGIQTPSLAGKSKHVKVITKMKLMDL